MRKGLSGHVYAIQPVGMDVVKVGTTTDPVGRTAQLAAFSPVPLVFRHLLMVDTKRCGQTWEADILGWSAFSGGYGEWRSDLALIDELFACIAPAVCVKDQYEIKRSRARPGVRMSPDALQDQMDFVTYLDLYEGWDHDALRKVGLAGYTQKPSAKTYDLVRAELAQMPRFAGAA